jgi:hypothetical protein
MTAVHALIDFANTRPGLDFANYGDITYYRQDARNITRDLHCVRELSSVARYLCTDQEILDAARSSRVEIKSFSDDNGAGYRVSYTPGQYYPVEYRAGVARVLSSAIWRAWSREIGDRPDACDRIRRRAKAEFSRYVVRRFFN